MKLLTFLSVKKSVKKSVNSETLNAGQNSETSMLAKINKLVIIIIENKMKVSAVSAESKIKINHFIYPTQLEMKFPLKSCFKCNRYYTYAMITQLKMLSFFER